LLDARSCGDIVAGVVNSSSESSKSIASDAVLYQGCSREFRWRNSHWFSVAIDASACQGPFGCYIQVLVLRLSLAVDALIIESPRHRNLGSELVHIVSEEVSVELVVASGVEDRVVSIIANGEIVGNIGEHSWLNSIAQVSFGSWIRDECLARRIEGSMIPGDVDVSSIDVGIEPWSTSRLWELVGGGRSRKGNHVHSIAVSSTSLTSIQTILRICHNF